MNSPKTSRGTKGFSLLGLAALLAATSCQTAKPANPLFEQLSPRSILVLPPLDETVETTAVYGTLAAVTKPLVNAGYYVFPVAVVDSMMRENGLPTPFEMHSVSMDKLREIFDPDAVLYLTVTDWGTSYNVLSSTTKVAIHGRLIHAESGQELWSGNHDLAQGSGGGGGGLGGLLTSALVNQVATSVADPSLGLAETTCAQLLGAPRTGWILGPYHPDRAIPSGPAQEVIEETVKP